MHKKYASQKSMGNNNYYTVSLMEPNTKYMDNIVKQIMYKHKINVFVGYSYVEGAHVISKKFLKSAKYYRNSLDNITYKKAKYYA